MTSVSELEAVQLAMLGYVVTTTDGAIVGRLRDHLFIRHRGQRIDLIADETTATDLLIALRQVLDGAMCRPTELHGPVPGACMR